MHSRLRVDQVKSVTIQPRNSYSCVYISRCHGDRFGRFGEYRSLSFILANKTLTNSFTTFSGQSHTGPQFLFFIFIIISYRFGNPLLPELGQQPLVCVRDSVASAFPWSDGTGRAQAPPASGLLFERIGVPHWLPACAPGEQCEWNGLKPPRCPNCRTTDPD